MIAYEQCSEQCNDMWLSWHSEDLVALELQAHGGSGTRAVWAEMYLDLDLDKYIGGTNHGYEHDRTGTAQNVLMWNAQKKLNLFFYMRVVN